MRLSWEVTKGSVLKITFAWVVILAAIVIFSGLLISAIELIEFFRENIYAQAAINGLLLTFLLPLLIGYGVQIVKRIEK
jgi:membrane-anchored glycerophosphoryl diester phosphodiesterase (GDPDase)